MTQRVAKKYSLCSKPSGVTATFIVREAPKIN
jgi:hypothetical protein